MVWAVVAVLAVVSCAATALLVRSVVSSRREFFRLPDTFRCRVRILYGAQPGIRNAWRRPVWAAWAHDVLLVRAGRFVPTTHVLRVCVAEGAVARVPPGDVPGFGSDPVILGLRLADGDLVEVAAPGTALEQLVGPFLAAALAYDGEHTDPRR